MHPATPEDSETISTFDVDWDPPALYEIETNEGFSLEDLCRRSAGRNSRPWAG
jgi:hypothetical protein